MHKITSAQLRKIWSTAKQRSIDKEDLYSIVEQITGTQSISSLTIQQAKQVIDRLEGKKQSNNQITNRQLWKIHELVKLLGWEGDPKRLNGFCQKYAKVERVHWLTRYQARNIIDGLKNLLKKQEQVI